MIPICEEKLEPITESGCLVWTGAASAHGYGSIRYRYKHYLVHRAAWQNAHGDIPEGMHVLHKCDVPPCCRVDHLFLGTNQDNIADSVKKGRRKGVVGRRWQSRKGKTCNWTTKEVSARLRRRAFASTETLAEELAQGVSQRTLAKKYGVAQATISRAAKGYRKC